MTAILSPNAKQQFLDNAGNPAAGFKLFVYRANTTTPGATYQDRAGSVPNSNPIILDARGEATIYLTSGLVYDYVLKTDTDAPVWTREDVIADDGSAILRADLADPAGGATLVGFLQAGANAVARDLQDKSREVFSVKDFGAKADGVTNDAVAIQRALNAAALVGGTVRIPKGRYLLNSTLTMDMTGHSSETLGIAVNIEGEGSANTILINATNNVGLDVFGSFANGSNVSYLTIKGVMITKTGDGTGDVGLRLAKLYWANFTDLVFVGNTLGTRFTDCVLLSWFGCTWRFNNKGLLAAGQVDPIGSTPNAISFFGCNFYGQLNYAAWFERGCNCNFYGGAIETTTGGSDAQRFGVKLNNPGTYGRAAAAFYGVYFERNGNTADVWAVNGDAPNAYMFSNCTFNRLNNTDFSVNNILLETNNNSATRITLTVEGCAFSRMGTYVANASRKYIDITGTSSVIFRDMGNMYLDKIERPTKESGDVLARARFTGAGALVRGYNVASITRMGTGVYNVAFLESNPAIAQRTYTVSCDVAGFQWVSAENGTSVEVRTANTTGVAVDPGLVCVTVME